MNYLNCCVLCWNFSYELPSILKFYVIDSLPVLCSIQYMKLTKMKNVILITIFDSYIMTCILLVLLLLYDKKFKNVILISSFDSHIMTCIPLVLLLLYANNAGASRLVSVLTVTPIFATLNWDNLIYTFVICSWNTTMRMLYICKVLIS